MSVSGSQTLRRSDMQRKLKELLHSVERAHKADIQTYSSGHLGPNRLTLKPLNCRPCKPIWNRPKCKDTGAGHIQEMHKTKANVEETIEALHGFTIRTIPRIQERIKIPSEELVTTDVREGLDKTELDTLAKGKQEHFAVSDSHDAELTWSDRLNRRKIFRTKDLSARKCLSGREAAKRHEHNLQQALRKLPAGRDPSRDRLTVFSDVFDDVCDGSPVFGSILREIKTEYDLYTRSLLSLKSNLQNKSAHTPYGGSIDATELKEAARQVLLLEQEARRALKENQRVRTEYEEAQAKALVDQTEMGWGSEDRNTNACDEVQYELSSLTYMEAKRQQLWKVWNEVQRLEKDIRETMVSTVTTSALENCIRDSEDEVMNYAASNVLLQRTNKDLEQDISVVLSKAKVSEEMKQVWEEIWTTLNGHC